MIGERLLHAVERFLGRFDDGGTAAFRLGGGHGVAGARYQAVSTTAHYRRRLNLVSRRSYKRWEPRYRIHQVRSIVAVPPPAYHPAQTKKKQKPARRPD